MSSLSKLSLTKPEYIAVDEASTRSTPASLSQSYVLCPLPSKLSLLYSFLKSHTKARTVAFLTSTAQVKHVYSLFCALQPGLPLLQLHGKMAQLARTKAFLSFQERPHGCLFATDVASRGLDFPELDWVVQVDCPSTPDDYIHRAGRTARNGKAGQCLLMLTDNEQPILENLKGRGCEVRVCKERSNGCCMNNSSFVTRFARRAANSATASCSSLLQLKRVSINASKAVSVAKRASALNASDPEAADRARRAFKGYVRSVHLETDKSVFSASSLDLEGYAKSLGLPKAPNVKSVLRGKSGEEGREEGKKVKNKNRKLERWDV